MRKLLVTLFCLTLTASLRAGSITVAAAVSLKEAVTEIARTYESQTGEHVEFTFGSSGQLMAQIKSGAPIDAFISAADKQLDELDKAGLIDPASRRVVAGNELVLIVPTGAANPPTRFEDLAGPDVKKLAIGEPKTVPAGQYAQQVLKHLSLEAKLGDRVVFGTNVRQVLAYVERGEVVCRHRLCDRRQGVRQESQSRRDGRRFDPRADPLSGCRHQIQPRRRRRQAVPRLSWDGTGPRGAEREGVHDCG